MSSSSSSMMTEVKAFPLFGFPMISSVLQALRRHFKYLSWSTREDHSNGTLYTAIGPISMEPRQLLYHCRSHRKGFGNRSIAMELVYDYTLRLEKFRAPSSVYCSNVRIRGVPWLELFLLVLESGESHPTFFGMLFGGSPFCTPKPVSLALIVS